MLVVDVDFRLAEFVSKSIDNLAQDMHVKDGMKYLGLRESVSLNRNRLFILTPCPLLARRISSPGWRFASSHIRPSALAGKAVYHLDRSSG
jgi:hypothetical protein